MRRFGRHVHVTGTLIGVEDVIYSIGNGGYMAALAIVLGVRPDLLRPALITGVVGTALAVPVYLAMEALFPGSIAATWDLPHLSGLLPLGIPIEGLDWYLYTAALWGTYYKFATGQSRPLASYVRDGNAHVVSVGATRRRWRQAPRA